MYKLSQYFLTGSSRVWKQLLNVFIIKCNRVNLQYWRKFHLTYSCGMSSHKWRRVLVHWITPRRCLLRSCNQIQLVCLLHSSLTLAIREEYIPSFRNWWRLSQPLLILGLLCGHRYLVTEIMKNIVINYFTITK